MRTCMKCMTTKEDSRFGVKVSSGKLKKWCKTCCRAHGRSTAVGQSKERNGQNYLSRWHNLKALGFKDYREYLASDLWREVRAKVFHAKGSICYLCPNPATELHHNRYHTNDLTGKRMKYIHPICRSCHERIEFVGVGQKAAVGQAKKSFKKLRKRKLDGYDNRDHAAKKYIPGSTWHDVIAGKPVIPGEVASKSIPMRCVSCGRLNMVKANGRHQTCRKCGDSRMVPVR